EPERGEAHARAAQELSPGEQAVLEARSKFRRVIVRVHGSHRIVDSVDEDELVRAKKRLDVTLPAVQANVARRRGGPVGDVLESQLELDLIRLAAIEHGVRETDARLLALERGEVGSCDERTGLLDREGRVEEPERLLRYGRLVPLRARRVRACEVEDAEDARKILALDEAIDRAPWRGRVREDLD